MKIGLYNIDSKMSNIPLMKIAKIKHRLKNSSSYIVVVLRSLRHKACITCNKPINSLEKSFEHWSRELSDNNQLELKF